MADTATHRLYFDDATLQSFDARVLALTSLRGQPAVVLDATAFYPEGGGQPADFGMLDGVAVCDVQEDDDIIYHLLREPLATQPGAVVTGVVDWPRRFDHMQQHTGQHIVSGAFWRLWGAETRSWHLGDAVVTIDVGRVGLSEDDLDAAARAANEVLWQDVAVTAAFYTPEQLAALELRKGSDRTGDIRVVSIGAWDRIGCGGTHVATSGQVGAIGIRRAEVHGTMTRIEFVCGTRALADYQRKTHTVNALSAALSAKPEDIVAQVERVQGQLTVGQQEIEGLRRQLSEFEARDLLAAASATIDGRVVVVARVDGRDAGALRQLAQRIVDGGGVALLGAVTGDKAQLVFACAKEAPLDMGQVLRAALPHIGGKGGGQRALAQGGGANGAGLDAALGTASATLLG